MKNVLQKKQTLNRTFKLTLAHTQAVIQKLRHSVIQSLIHTHLLHIHSTHMHTSGIYNIYE